MSIATVLLTVHTVILVLGSMLLLYPVVAFAWNVAYTEEILLLAASFVLLAGAYVTGFVFEITIASSTLDLASATASFWAMWRLANRFMAAENDSLGLQTAGGPVQGGFGDVDSGGSEPAEMDSDEVTRGGS